MPKVAGYDCRWKGKLFSKFPMCKYYFQTKFKKKKKKMLVKALKPPFFAVFSSDLKQRYFFHERKCDIGYSFSIRYLIDVNWLYISCKVTKKSQLREANKIIAIWCYWKFNTEVPISEFLKSSVIWLSSKRQKNKNLYNLLI